MYLMTANQKTDFTNFGRCVLIYCITVPFDRRILLSRQFDGMMTPKTVQKPTAALHRRAVVAAGGQPRSLLAHPGGLAAPAVRADREPTQWIRIGCGRSVTGASIRASSSASGRGGVNENKTGRLLNARTRDRFPLPASAMPQAPGVR